MKKHIWMYSVCLTAMIGLNACLSGDPTTHTDASEPASGRPEARNPAMDREITALKASESDPAEISAQLREILPRYGYSLPSSPSFPAFAPDLSDAALGKTAISVQWKTVKDFGITFPFAFYDYIDIAPGGHLEVSTNTESPCDPMLVAFIETSNASATAHKVTFVAQNDDRGDGTRNARIYWQNNTGSTQIVKILAYAYSDAVVGFTDVYVTDGTRAANYRHRRIDASPVYSHTQPGPFAGCGSAAQGSRIRLIQSAGGGFRTGLLAFNMQTMRGGILMESSVSDQALTLDDVLPNSGAGGSYLVGVMLAQPEPAMEYTLFRGLQQNSYICN